MIKGETQHAGAIQKRPGLLSSSGYRERVQDASGDGKERGEAFLGGGG